MSAHAGGHVDPTALVIPEGHPLRKAYPIGLVVGAVGLVAAIVMGLRDHAAFAHSWLLAYVYFLSLALGGLIFTLIQHVARAGWSVVVRRLSENVMSCVWLFALLFLPIALHLHDLYHWSHHEAVEHDAVLQAKAPYLNPTFFFVRAGVFFAAWILMARWFTARSLAQDATGDPEHSRRMATWSGACIVVFAFTTTFAAFDWLMSLDPHWYSTIFGGYFFSGCLVGFFAFLILLIMLLQSQGILGKEITLEHFHDMGKLLFAFTVFWAYIAFSQFMLIWYANMPEETIWFEKRFQGSWKQASLLLMVGHFIVPFFYLMPRTVKRFRPALLLGVLWMLAMHWLDLAWLVMPNHHPEGFHVGLLDLACFMAVGGFFVAVLSRRLCRHPLVPVRDPRLSESLAFENF